ncbi:MAG: hypothetical protein N2316_02570 [Spirochaetes bacterium]|nr:hypothetical protein [Spirochaetota bacterium]
MTVSPADIFKTTTSSAEFKNRLIMLDGNFPFETQDMIELGKEYFSRYPDSASDRNLREIHEGYAIARSCILEKMLCNVETAHKPKLRVLFDDISMIEVTVNELKKEIGIEKLKDYIALVDRNLASIMAKIDEIPKGMIKERYIGGITKFFNVMYILRSKV